jgi:hypothetical protein
MRIALRTGGGRGVYELAGRQGDQVASDLFGLEIFYELTPNIVIAGRSVAERRQGKPRIALDLATTSTTTHVYRLLSAVLLLPKPKREFRTTHGTQLLGFETYSMTAIKVDVAGISASTVVLRPTDLLLENADGLQLQVDFTSRMARILRLWKAAEEHNSPIATLIRDLSTAVRSADPDYKSIERCARSVATAVNSDGDILPLLEQLLIASSDEMESPQVGADSTFKESAVFGIDDEISPQEALVQRIRIWRRQVERGASGRRFGLAVSSAYDYRCFFTGQRLPRLDVTDSAGVDSAHILPWSIYDLDSVKNGLCLSKQCHWAFDQGILRLDFDRSSQDYIVSVPDRVRIAAIGASFDLGYFESLAGPIPQSRLPENMAFWPSPGYLAELNRYMTRT